jgi:hypothetical protein
MTSTDLARKCAGIVTGVSSYVRPSGKRKPCLSQNERRHTLFHAGRSASSGRYLVTCVFSRVSANAYLRNGDWKVAYAVSRWTLPVAKSEPVRSSAPTSSSYAFSGSVSSLSRNTSRSPPACSVPVLRALLRPPFSWWTSLNRGSRSTYRWAISALRSVDPSLTRIASKSVNVCASSESRHGSRNSSTL